MGWVKAKSGTEQRYCKARPCLIDVRIDVLAIKWLADLIGGCSRPSSSFSPSWSPAVRHWPVVECTNVVVHEGLGLQVESGRWRRLAGLLQLSSRQIGQCQKSGAGHHPFLKTEAGDPTPAGRI